MPDLDISQPAEITIGEFFELRHLGQWERVAFLARWAVRLNDAGDLKRLDDMLHETLYGRI